MNYYNEHNKFRAQWLRNLIKAGMIPKGEVDDRSITDVRGTDLKGFTQCHFFAGIGGWSFALALAGWTGREVWTGSCPCQPFSLAGKLRAFDDDRHLWPVWFELIRERKPDIIFGEQVLSKSALPWVDGVFTDMESLNYACAAFPIPSACVNSPNIRHRIYWVSDSNRERWRFRRGPGQTGDPQGQPAKEVRETNGQRIREVASGTSEVVRLSDTESTKREWNRTFEDRRQGRFTDHCEIEVWNDGSKRRVKPGASLLVDEFSGRRPQIRALGDAINVEVAAEFIATYMEEFFELS